jgi:hypothetical protein
VEGVAEEIEQPKSHGRDGEEVHRCDCLPMVLQKREPSFRGFWISRSASHPTGNRSLRNIESEHLKVPRGFMARPKSRSRQPSGISDCGLPSKFAFAQSLAAPLRSHANTI